MKIMANRMDRGFYRYQQEFESKALEVLRSGWYVLGNEVKSFEEEFAAYTGGGYCVGLASGLDALWIAFRLLGIGPGDEVIVQGNTYIASVMGITINGATPVFVEPNEYHGGKAFYDFVSRVTYDKSQKFEESKKMAFYDDKISRLCVDIFVTDALPAGPVSKRLTKLCHCIVYGLALGHRYGLSLSDYKGMMKLFVFVLSSVGRLIPFPVIYRCWRRLCLKDRKKNYPLYFYSGYAPDYFYVEMEKDWEDQVEEMEFEDTKFYVPSGWKQLLTQLYGDFMKLPPKEKQIPEHSDMEIQIYE